MAKKSLEDIIRRKLERLDSVPDAFISSVEKAQKQVYKDILKSISSFETQGGKIILNQKNLANITTISEKLRESLFGGEYKDAVETFVKEIATQSNITNSYFSNAFSEAFTEQTIYKEVLKASITQTLALYSENALEQVLITLIREQLFASITSGSSMADMIDAVTEGITGLKGEGKLLSYVKRISYDAFAVNDRSYTNIIAESLEVEWYKYTGGLISDTRTFCAERNGKFYNKNEIKAWASKDWQGKRAGTNGETIFNFAGGYNCKHSILPVPESAVPSNVIERNKQD